MKVVLFCGGQGMRLMDYSTLIPKPLVPVGPSPILYNVMRYYAHYGHTEFILCLGHKADAIRNYFLNSPEFQFDDLHPGNADTGPALHFTKPDLVDWKVTLLDTGLNSNIGQRLLRAKPYLDGDHTFLANYSDGLTDLNIDDMVEAFEAERPVAAFMAYKSRQSFHVVSLQGSDSGTLGGPSAVKSIKPIADCGLLINCGYFILSRQIFDFIEEGDELVEEPFQRLIQQGRLMAYPYSGFWAAMDTLKDKNHLDELYLKGSPPWEVWREERAFLYADIPTRKPNRGMWRYGS